MKKTINSKHSRSVFIFALLSLFMCMSSGKVSAEELKPVIKIDKTSYTSSGTEVTLKLWMFNWKKTIITTKDYNARFIGDVYLYIDDKEVGRLTDMWPSISGSSYLQFKDTPGDVGKCLNFGLQIGTAQFKDSKGGQTCPYNSNTTEKSWITVDLQFSFRKKVSYYGHKITVKGKWQDQSSGTLVEKDVVLNTYINGFVRPINLKVQPSGDKIKFTFDKQGYTSSASTDGTWEIYKRDIFKTEKLRSNWPGSYNYIIINKSQYTCSKDYILAFRPKACEGEDTVCGLTTKMAATEHQMNDDDICQKCGHSYFRYQTSNGSKVTLFYYDFGANYVGQKRVDDMWAIECDGPITKIPQRAFLNSMITGNFVIPNTVTEIGDQAFEGCTGLTGNWTIPNSVTTIGNSAFSGCTGFTGNLTIPNTVKTIGSYAFSGCTGFKGNLTIPNSVTTIGESAFEECWGFKGKLTISNYVKTIGNSAFSYCSGFMGDLTIPNSVTTIGNSAFYKCSGFKGKLTISNSVKTIGNSAFSYCSGFTGDLLLPKSLEVVGYRSFEDLNYIQPINFQSLPTGIGNQNKYKTVSLSDDSYISDQAAGPVGAISYTRTMTSNWGTLVLPYSLTLTGSEPYRLYEIETLTGDELVLSRLEGVVAAGTPCIVKRNGTEAELTFDANDVKLNMTRATNPVGDMTFSGTYWTEDVNSGYVISKDRFWNVAELNGSASVKGVKVQPFRAWLSGTSANAPACLSIRIDGSTTGINAAEALDALNDAEAEYYNLSGKRLDAPQHGVNIVRMKSGKTKKIIIK